MAGLHSLQDDNELMDEADLQSESLWLLATSQRKRSYSGASGNGCVVAINSAFGIDN
jgi:hypothetical protein